ncbi:MAG: B12-binding domain-containing radical SAM protein [Pseudodesulfovibrio sp.]|nr:B12-binding domain-containing radical SAM protein [Pseudodesulfovibrio sp.]
MSESSKVKGTMCRCAVVVPPVVAHNLDPHTGIPFMPHMGASLAGVLREIGHDVQVVDCFGGNSHSREMHGEFMFLGLSAEIAASLVHDQTQVCFIYCRQMSEMAAAKKVAQFIKAAHPSIKICFFENIQAVTSFSFKDVTGDLFESPCDLLIMGEPEDRAKDIVERFLTNSGFKDILGVAYKEGSTIKLTEASPYNRNLDALPLPAWDIFPLDGYWKAGFSHGPVGKERFLPLLTSRGCPYKCKFCLAPHVNNTWRAHSAKRVVDEIEHFYNLMQVTDFHISDLNPTVNEKRILEICDLLIERKLPVSWKLAQGTKIETLSSPATLERMAEAGCVYISFSPESGSKRMLESVGKPFDYEHALRMTAAMHRLGIRSQACFISGLPGETEADRLKTIVYMKKLVKAGLDEINVPIFTPVPGSEFEKAIEGYSTRAQITFSPTWRKDYSEAHAFRMKMYRTFFLWKLLHPRKVFREIFGFLTGNFETKMEMSFYKLIKLHAIRWAPWLFS